MAILKRKIAKKYKISFPSNIELLKAYHNLLKNKRIKKTEGIEEILRTRPVRSLSGIVNVSVLTKPYYCPGKCLFCPLEKGMPKSYLSEEPAAERAKRLNFDPFLQVKARVATLKNEGHSTDKIDLRIIGGTWSFYPKNYQKWFIKRCFDGVNQKSSRDLNQAQKINEKTKNRIIGISIETRPDFINEREIIFMRELGITRVELGVQSLYEKILKINLRGHTLQETIEATRLLKDAGFKICYQMMPNLLGSDLKKDEEMFEELFENPNFKPDYLKIYPCAIVKSAPLYKFYLKGKYKPYSKEELINLIKRIKLKVPYYVRIQRINRDIPSKYIVEGGAKISNLRQMVQVIMEKEGLRCKCIRCREIKERYDPREKIYLFREDYQASKGREIFLSFENKKRTKLFSYLRLRIPSQVFAKEKHFLKVLENSAIIREIQTFGKVVPLGQRKIAPQHQGLGKKLVKEAERISKKDFKLKKISVISGIGARDYWRKLGYRLKETYMVKNI